MQSEIRTHESTISSQDWGNFMPNITITLPYEKNAYGWMAGWLYRRICRQQYSVVCHGRDKFFAAAKDVWIPLMHRNIAATAKYCKSCLEAGKNLKPDIPKSGIGVTYVPKEPNDLVQFDFWGPVNYVRGRMKYVLVAVDTFSHWPSAYVCSSNKSKMY